MSTLSWSTRIKAFCICFVLGILLSFLGSIALFLHRGIVVFAVFYTIGNLVSMARWVDNRNISHLPANYLYIHLQHVLSHGSLQADQENVCRNSPYSDQHCYCLHCHDIRFSHCGILWFELFLFPPSSHLWLFVCSWKRPDWRLYSSSYSPWPWPGTRYPIYPMPAMRYAAPSLPASRFRLRLRLTYLKHHLYSIIYSNVYY